MENRSKRIEDENEHFESIQDDKSKTENIDGGIYIPNLQNEDVREPERAADSFEEGRTSSNNTNSLEEDKEEAKNDKESDKFTKNKNNKSEESLEIGNECFDSPDKIPKTTSVENLLIQSHREVENTETNNEMNNMNHAANEILNDLDDNILSGGDETDGKADEVIEAPVLVHITSKRVKAPKRNKPSQRFLKDNKNIPETLIEVEDEPEKSNETEPQDENSFNSPKERARVESMIRPPLGRPAGSVRLMPAGGAGDGGDTQPDWMKELNKKNKERKEKAALEEKTAKDIEAAKQKLEPDEVDENPEANGCCIMF